MEIYKIKPEFKEMFLQPKNRKELAAIYGVTVSNINNWLYSIGFEEIPKKYVFTPNEVDYIFEKLGIPERYKI
jgi:hypothetical protein